MGETRAALEAAEAASLARVPGMNAALEGIAHDESEHAALAWRVVRWILAEHPELAPVAGEEFARALEPELAADPASRDAIAGAHGLLDGATRLRVHRAAASEVIDPCARALLDVLRAA